MRVLFIGKYYCCCGISQLFSTTHDIYCPPPQFYRHSPLNDSPQKNRHSWQVNNNNDTTTITNQIDTVSVKPNSTVCADMYCHRTNRPTNYINPPFNHPHLACQIKLFATRRRHVIIIIKVKRVCIYVCEFLRVVLRLPLLIPLRMRQAEEEALARWTNHRNIRTTCNEHIYLWSGENTKTVTNSFRIWFTAGEETTFSV